VTPAEPASLPLASGRRWDDRLGDMPTMTFARLLKGQPPLDDVMRLLVALLCWPVGAQGAMIVRFVAGQFEILASYVDGVLDPLDLQDQPLPSDVVEIVTEAAGRQPVVWTDPEDASRRPLAAWSLGPASADSTVLVLFCANPVPARLVSSRVDDVAEILGVYLIGDDTSRMRRTASPVAAATGDDAPLTPRQLAILDLMAEGCTNPQIAGRIGFSVSTVRMESLRMYRALGVHDRTQAVVAGRALGLLGEN
jgi:DNA-binding CsgD family transcriptional regulator